MFPMWASSPKKEFSTSGIGNSKKENNVENAFINLKWQHGISLHGSVGILNIHNQSFLYRKHDMRTLIKHALT